MIKDAHSLYLAGKRDPEAHAINQINVLGRIVPYAPVFIIGSGNLHYLEEVLNNTDDSVSVLLYEPIFSIFYRQLEIIDFEKIFRNRTIALVVDGINDDGIDSLLKTMLNGDKVPILKQILLPNYEKLANEKMTNFLKKIIEISHRYQVNLATRQLFNHVMADNFYHNVKYVKSGYMAQQGNPLGAIIWFIANIIFWFVKRKMFEVGYTSGTKLITNLGKSLTTFTEAASIMGLSVVGALIASSVKMTTALNFKVGEVSLALQTDVLDRIMPSLLPVLLTALVYKLLGNKKWTATKLILLIIVIALVCSFFGILTV